MTTTINASPTNGIVQTADGSGVMKLQSNGVTTNALAWGSYAFVANGSTPTLRSSYNISSITRNSSGSFTFAFTNATSDANYSVCASPTVTGTASSVMVYPYTQTTSSFTVFTGYPSNTSGTSTGYDAGVSFTVFGN